MSSAISSTPTTTWWYGQGRALATVRRVETLASLTPTPVGVVSVLRDELLVTFVEALRTPLPPPWQPVGASEASIAWDVVETGEQPNPDHRAPLVVMGTTDDGALKVLNLGVFSRMRVNGDPSTAAAVVNRWVLELLATHPGTTVGITTDTWPGPYTRRVRPVTVGQAIDVDVLVLGAGLSYADRAQIVDAAASRIVLDLGEDAALSTRWTLTCGSDRSAQLRGAASTAAMSATLIIPNADTVELCTSLLTQPAPGSAGPTAADDAAAPQSTQPAFFATDLPSGPAADTDPATADTAHHGADDDHGIDFFAAAAPPEGTPAPSASPWDALGISTSAAPPPQPLPRPPTPPPSQPLPRPPTPPPPPVAEPPAAAGPQLTGIWNRILGQVQLHPPHGGKESARDKRLNELTVFLQRHGRVSTDTIIRGVYGRGATAKTVTQQMSLLRGRLGDVRPGGPKALPPMTEQHYHLDKAVRSDWTEFERLVKVLVETTATADLIAAMDLVTGPPLGGIPTREWAWAKDLRDEIRDRVAGAAVVLAHRHHSGGDYASACQTARKGLWYDTARQDLWQAALQAALDGHDDTTFRTLREQYLAEIPSGQRDPAVFDLTGRSG